MSLPIEKFPLSIHLESLPSKEAMFEKMLADYWLHVQSLNIANVLEPLPELGSLGIRDAEGHAYPLPTPEIIRQLCEKNWELIQYKWLQGFTQLQVTPIALPSGCFTRRLDTRIRWQSRWGRLFLDNENIGGSRRTRINSSEYTAVYVTDQAKRARYFPKSFSDEHQSLSKEEVILQTAATQVPGWHVCLIEPHFHLPTQEKSYKIGDRRQLIAGDSSDYYLNELKEPEYCGETGFTIEDLLTHFLVRLIQTEEVSSVYSKYSGMCCIGNYALGFEKAVCAGWDIFARAFGISCTSSENYSPISGTRTAVRLNMSENK